MAASHFKQGLSDDVIALPDLTGAGRCWRGDLPILVLNPQDAGLFPLALSRALA